MSREIHVTPGRLTRSAAGFTAFLAALFLAFGVVLLLGTDSPDEDVQVLKLAFLAVWVAACLGLIVHALRVAVRPKGSTPASLFTLEPGGEARLGSDPDFDVRLRKLEALRGDGLVSDDEYRRKREEILREKW